MYFFTLGEKVNILACVNQGERREISDPHQPLVSGVDDGVEHGLVEQTVTHPLRDDDVHTVHWQLHLLHLTLYNGHNWKNRK